MPLTTYAKLARILRPLLRFDRTENPDFFRQRFGDLEVVHRNTFLVEVARGRRVLHFGFLDHPLTTDKLTDGRLLHARIGKVAASLYGLDVDASALELYRSVTGDRENGLLDIEADGPLDAALRDRFDLILFADILEHLRNPGRALERLRDISLANPGSALWITVPNALSLKNAAQALDGTELVHPGHYTYFSPHTLRSLVESSGLAVERIVLCSNSLRDTRDALGLAHDGVGVLCRPRATG